MKAIVFLAGVGNRLRSLTDTPKCLIKINNTSLIINYLEILNNLGLKQVTLVVGYQKEKIIHEVGDSYKNLEIKYIENKDYEKGSILTLLSAKDEFDDEVITLDGDIIFDKKILQNLINSEDKNYFLVG